MMHHLDEDVLQRYVSHSVSDQERLEVDSHLADCADCARRVQASFYLQRRFDPLWDEWTAAEHGRAYEQWRLVKAAREIAEAEPSLADRVKQWLGQFRSDVGFSLKVLIDKSHKVAAVAQDVFAPGYEFRLCPKYSGVGTPEQEKQLDSHLKRGSEFLSQDRQAQALDELLEAVKIDARTPQSATSEVFSEGRRVLQMVVDSRRGRIWAKSWPEEGQEPPGMAILLPGRPELRALAIEFRKVEDEPYLLAEFEDVLPGIYSLWIGPTLAEE